MDAHAYTSVADMLEQARRYADPGARKSDRIAILMPTFPAFPIAMLGIIRASATELNVNPLYMPRDVGHQLNDSRAGTTVIFKRGDADASRRVARPGMAWTRELRPVLNAEVP
jgi:acyl-coenzyme A synthetase/AMP-(fatty) acid ligase